MKAAEHLAKLGVSFDQARDFIYANLGNLGLIYDTAILYGVTSDMLAELYGQGVNAAVVEQFFDANGFNGQALAAKSLSLFDTSSSDWIDLLFTDANVLKLSALFRPNDHQGVLSTESLSSALSLRMGTAVFNAMVDPRYMDANDDGVVTAEEADAPGMPAFPATTVDGASHALGLMVRVLKGLDQAEVLNLRDMARLPSDVSVAETEQMMSQFFSAFIDAIVSPADIPLWTDQEISQVILSGVQYLGEAGSLISPSLFTAIFSEMNG